MGENIKLTGEEDIPKYKTPEEESSQDLAKSRKTNRQQGESQIYNWGIKRDTSLGGVRDDYKNRKSNDTSSNVSSNDSITENAEKINPSDENSSKNPPEEQKN